MVLPLSVVVLAWDQLHFTERCVRSIRAHTDVDYELIVVDNGSAAPAAARAGEMADVPVLLERNLGFAAGMNRGLEAASGDYVAFLNNDTVVPARWASTLLETAASHPAIGIALPAVTAAGNPISVRERPGTEVSIIAPFTELPSGVVYLLRTATIRSLGGWDETYPVATAEDLDLLFTTWANDLDVVLDERVLVEHESQGTLSEKIEEPWALQAENLERFLDRWASADHRPVRIPECPPDVHERNVRSGRVAATWLRRYLEARDRAGRLERQMGRMRSAQKPTLIGRLLRSR